MKGLISDWLNALVEMREIKKTLNMLGMIRPEDEQLVEGVIRLGEAFFDSQASYLQLLRINEELTGQDTRAAARDHPHPPPRTRERANRRDHEDAFRDQFGLVLVCRKCRGPYDNHVRGSGGEFICTPNLDSPHWGGEL